MTPLLTEVLDRARQLTVGEDALRERRVEEHLGKPPGWLQELSPEERTTISALVEKTRRESK